MLIFIFFYLLLYQSKFEVLVLAVECQYYPNYPSTIYKFTIDCAEKCCETQYPLTSNDACCTTNNFRWYYVVIPLLGVFMIFLIALAIWFFCFKKGAKIISQPIPTPSMTSRTELMGSRQPTNLSIVSTLNTPFSDGRLTSQSQLKSRSGVSKRSSARSARQIRPKIHSAQIIDFVDYELMFEKPPVYETYDQFKAKKASVKNKSSVSFYENPLVILPINSVNQQSVPDLKEYEEQQEDSSPEPSFPNTPSTLIKENRMNKMNLSSPESSLSNSEKNKSNLADDFQDSKKPN